MKRCCALISFLLFLALLCADGVQPAGSGTSGDPWQVATLDNLLWVSTNSTSWDDHFIQTADIDASSAPYFMLGSYTDHFTGVYDGGYHSISNYTITGSWAGLFSITEGAIIRNLAMLDVDITGLYSIGPVAGHLGWNSLVENCFSSGNVSTGSTSGGIVGAADESTVSGCYSTANCGLDHIGSIAGGIVGYASASTITNCYSNGACYAYDGAAGGIAGELQSSSVVSNCFSATTFTPTPCPVGGVVGMSDASTVTSSFWDIEASGQTTSAGGTGKTTAEMQDVATYTSLATVGLDTPWDFVGDPYDDTASNDTWNIDPVTNGGYPFLSWQETNVISIYHVQGQQDASPYVGQTITTSGVVTAEHPHGFFIQDGENPWCGVFVYVQDYSVHQGDLVTVNAEVSEYYETTELTAPTDITILSSGHALPNPVVMNTGEVSEPYEGMLAYLENATCVDTVNMYGAWQLDDGSGAVLVGDAMYPFEPTLGCMYDIIGPVWDSTGGYELLPRYSEDVVEVFALIADFTADNTLVYPGQAIQFTDLSTGGVTSWAWDFDNNGTTDSSEQHPVWSYTSGGLHSVSLTVVAGDITATETKTDYILVRDGTQQDSLALVVLYNRTNGDNWTDNTGWLTDAPIDDWYGVTVEDGRVRMIDITNNNLVGTIPLELSLCSDLFFLGFEDNALYGDIPPELGQLSNLNYLWLDFNSLSGIIPPELSQLTNLRCINLKHNELSGDVPASLSELESLSILWLQNNQLESLPDLSSLTSLLSVSIENNRLTFEDIEPNLGVPSQSFFYSPQDSVYAEEHVTILEDSDYTLHATVGGSANSYQWYRDGAPAGNDSILVITDAQASDAGTYTCAITSAVVTDLTLHRYPVHVTVTPTNDPPGISLPDMFEFPQNESVTIDFAPYISDPDGDSLSIIVNGNTHVAAEVNEYLVTLSSSDNWVGAEDLTFTVDDGVVERVVFVNGSHGSRDTAFDTAVVNVFNPLNINFHTNSELNNNVVAGDEELALTFTVNAFGDTLTSWAWDFDNDGTVDSYEESPTWVYQTPGEQTVSLEVSDGTHLQWLVKPDYVLVHPGETVPGGEVVTDIVWTEAGGPYNLTGGLLLNDQITLTIEPNTQVNLLMDSTLVVNGSLIASDADFTAYGESGWEGLVFNPASTGNVVDGLHVVGASTAITIHSASPVIENLVIEAAPGGRSHQPGIILTGAAAPQLQGVSIRGHATGVQAINDTGECIEVQWSGVEALREAETPGPDDVGLSFTGAYDIEIDSLLIDGFTEGFRLDDPTPDPLAPSRVRLTNTRVRQTENTEREPMTGVRLVNTPTIEMEADTLTGFAWGVDIDNSGLAAVAQIDISNISISHENIVEADTGLRITGPSTGVIDSLHVRNYCFALDIEGDNHLQVHSLQARNCGVGLLLQDIATPFEMTSGVAWRDSLYSGDEELPALHVRNSSSVTLSNWTVYGCELGLVTEQSPVSLTNSIVWRQTPMETPFQSVGAQPVITYCDVNWSDGVYAGAGNLNENPLFEDAAAGDFALNVYSPCIDAGDPSGDPDPDGSVPDMGAVWFDQDNMPLIADFFWDVDSGLVPLAVQFTDHATFNTTSWQWDLDGDGAIDSTEPSPHWTYMDTGQYDVSLRVSDGVRDTTLLISGLIHAFNAAPHIVQPLPDMNVDEDFAPLTIVLSAYIADENGDSLDYVAESSNSNVTATVSRDTLTITGAGDWFGQTTITITADDGRRAAVFAQPQQRMRSGNQMRDQVSDDFVLTVNAVNDAPYLLAPLPDTTAVQNFTEPIIYQLDDYFADVEQTTLQYSLTYDADAINAVVDGAELTLTSVTDWFGDTSVIVTADDFAGRLASGNQEARLSRAVCVDTFTVHIDEVAVGEEAPEHVTMLGAACPNPFNGETRVSFSLAAPSRVRLDVYNVRGQHTATLADGDYEAGEHYLVWNTRGDDGAQVASGVYFLRMQAGRQQFMKKLLYLK